MAKKTVLKHLLKNFGPLTSEIAGALKADSLNYQGNKCGYDVPNLQTEIVLPALKADEDPDKESAPEQIEASAEAVAPVSETTPEAETATPAKSIRESTKEAADLFTEKIKGALKS